MARYAEVDEPTSRLNNLAWTLSEHRDEYLKVMYAASVLEKLPTANVRPIIYAHWIKKDGEQICSACGGVVRNDPECGICCCGYDYCPACGAEIVDAADGRE